MSEENIQNDENMPGATPVSELPTTPTAEVTATMDGSPPEGEAPLSRVYDLTVPVSVELGRTEVSVQEILDLSSDSVVELDRAADAPVELVVHGKCVARGEIVVVDDYYGVRITEIVGQ